MNYFSLFDIAQQYQLDLDSLAQRYRVLQRLTHPDKHASASDQEKRMYMQKNAQINDGFRVLSDMVARGEHLLELRGVELPSEQETIGDIEFLMEQMELRESLASASNLAEVQSLIDSISESITTYIEHISKLLANNTESDNHSAGLELSKLKFLKKIAAEAKARAQKETIQ